MDKKIKVNYNINESTLVDFNKKAKERAINKSGLIEIMMKDWLKSIKMNQTKNNK